MENFDTIFSGIRKSVENKYKGIIEIKNIGKEYKFKIFFKQAIQTQDDIDILIEVLDYTISLVKVIA